MRLARYIGGGQIAIVDEPIPDCPDGGLLVKAEASGLCSGELMQWYMDQKIPHVLGHEVAGKVIESQDGRFPEGSRVFAHHHAPCRTCHWCEKGLYVHCAQWKRTKLVPGGMAEFFAVSRENLTDTLLVDDLRPVDAALIEPLACVAKSLHLSGLVGTDTPTAVIGLGVMGLMHLSMLTGGVGYELNANRAAHAKSLGLKVADAKSKYDAVVVCPGSKEALDVAVDLINPGGTICLFAPMPPGSETPVDLNRLYFQDVRIVNSYSCGPDDTRQALEWLRASKIKAEQVVSDFIEMEELPQAYLNMKEGKILKPMVVF